MTRTEDDAKERSAITGRLPGAVEGTDDAAPSVDGRDTRLARYRPFLLRACAVQMTLALRFTFIKLGR